MLYRVRISVVRKGNSRFSFPSLCVVSIRASIFIVCVTYNDRFVSSNAIRMTAPILFRAEAASFRIEMALFSMEAALFRMEAALFRMDIAFSLAETALFLVEASTILVTAEEIVPLMSTRHIGHTTLWHPHSSFQQFLGACKATLILHMLHMLCALLHIRIGGKIISMHTMHVNSSEIVVMKIDTGVRKEDKMVSLEISYTIMTTNIYII
jgi:hypothetical protein